MFYGYIKCNEMTDGLTGIFLESSLKHENLLSYKVGKGQITMAQQIKITKLTFQALELFLRGKIISLL